MLQKKSKTTVNQNKPWDLFFALLGPALWIALLNQYISAGTVQLAGMPLVSGWQAIVGLGLLFIIFFSFPYFYLKNIWLQKRSPRKESKDE